MGEMKASLKESKNECCVCGKPATKSMQYSGGEREYPVIHYCDEHGEHNDNFNKRSTS
jgi:hypothetical protein